MTLQCTATKTETEKGKPDQISEITFEVRIRPAIQHYPYADIMILHLPTPLIGYLDFHFPNGDCSKDEGEKCHGIAGMTDTAVQAVKRRDGNTPPKDEFDYNHVMDDLLIGRQSGRFVWHTNGSHGPRWEAYPDRTVEGQCKRTQGSVF